MVNYVIFKASAILWWTTLFWNCFDNSELTLTFFLKFEIYYILFIPNHATDLELIDTWAIFETYCWIKFKIIKCFSWGSKIYNIQHLTCFLYSTVNKIDVKRICKSLNSVFLYCCYTARSKRWICTRKAGLFQSAFLICVASRKKIDLLW